MILIIDDDDISIFGLFQNQRNEEFFSLKMQKANTESTMSTLDPLKETQSSIQNRKISNDKLGGGEIWSGKKMNFIRENAHLN